jgi:MFS family permease
MEKSAHPGADIKDKDNAKVEKGSNARQSGAVATSLREHGVELGFEALKPSFCLAETLRQHGISIPYDGSSLPQEPWANSTRFQSPYDWTARKKRLVLGSTLIAAMLAAYSAGAYAFAAGPLRERWGVTFVEYNLGITVFVAGFGIAPMMMAPITESHGRYWVFVFAGVVFLIGTIGCAVSGPSYPGMLISRFVTGNGASIAATLVGGVVGDLYRKEERNTPMALYSFAIFAGTGVGPLVSGVTVDRLGWPWIFWIQCITIGLTTLGIFFFFEETRENVVLKKKCRALNQLYTGIQLPLISPTATTMVQPVFRTHLEEKKLRISAVGRSFAFPLKLLATESIVFWFSAWVSFAWSILYMQFSSIGITFRDVYGFSNTAVGAVYAATIVGSALGAFFGILQDTLLRRYRPDLMATPEGRLLPACVMSVLLPIGLFWFGWTARPDISWISPSIAIGCCTMGIFTVYLAVFNYLADAYHRYASSALAAQSMCRNTLAGVLTLVVEIMFRNLGYGGAGSLLGGLALLLTGIPWLLIVFGKTIRERSPFAKELLKQ